MNIHTNAGLVGLLLALSALQIPSAIAITQPTDPNPSSNQVELRLHRLTVALREREAQLQNAPLPEHGEMLLAGWVNGSNGRGAVVTPAGRGWGNGAGDRGWVNTAVGGGFRNSGGGFVNNPWRNAWSNGGGFFNQGSGGGFVNRGGGTFWNN